MHCITVVTFCFCVLGCLVLYVSGSRMSRRFLRSSKYSNQRNVLDSDESLSLEQRDNVFHHDGASDASPHHRENDVNLDNIGHGSAMPIRQSSDTSIRGKKSTNGDSSHVQHDNIFRWDSDVDLTRQQDSFSRRIVIANSTLSLDIQPSIRACQCDGSTCITKERHVGDSISICLFSNFLHIQAVKNMTLHVGDVSYQPVVDGVVNELTELSLHGKLAVVTTMTISAFFDHANPSDLDLTVDATVSFAPIHGGGGGRRLVANITNHSLGDNPARSLLVTTFTRLATTWACLISTIIVFAAAIGVFVARRHCRHRPEHLLAGQEEEEAADESCRVSK